MVMPNSPVVPVSRQLCCILVRRLLLLDIHAFGLSLFISGIECGFFFTLILSPFIKREIEHNIKNYILESLQELPINSNVKVLLHVPHSIDLDDRKLVADAIHNYFNYCHDGKAKKLRQLLRTGRISLTIALVFLGTCITIDNLISSLFGGTIVKILHEGLFIVGWVAMWRPIEIFLYDWVPIYQEQRIFRKLCKVSIEIKSLEETA